jgi:hypothetical protein
MHSIGNFQKVVISVISIAKPKTLSPLPLYMYFVLFHGDFCIDLYSVDIDEAMKQGDEALQLVVRQSPQFSW